MNGPQVVEEENFMIFTVASSLRMSYCTGSFRSSRSQMSFKIGLPKIVANVIEK